jgi:hypothetical protein
VTASTKAEVEDKLEKSYAKASDANALEIIHDCRTKTVPSYDVEAAGAQSDRAKGAMPASSEGAASQVIVRLQIDPELRRRAESLSKEPGRFGTDPPLAP